MKFKQYLYLRDEAIGRLAQATPTEAEWDLQTYAFVGDAVYSVFVRTRLAETGIAKTRVLHDLAARLVAAKNQSAVLRSLWDTLTEEERDLCRRARNLSLHAPASATLVEYQQSTAWEALLGYCYRHNQKERLETLLQTAWPLAQEVMRHEIQSQT